MRIPRLHKETSLYQEEAIAGAIADAAKEAEDNLESAMTDIRYWTRFSDTDGMIIGEENSSTNAQLRSDRLDFNYGGVSQAHVGSNGFETDKQVTTPNLTLERYAWVYDEGDECLYLKRVM